ncbi:MAG: substrate-binding domain-containing protein [Treponema sp.]|uniref:substrate-binding domain-containing protein n=1 Tax=Treponema sp. TaxID=166 RepID=UPI00298DEEC7|nr:substrate-binding domain-containing protein [Treponema sp.]MBR5933819.1 substrate-binding domain-containing protein [Treponema sp.]
MQQNKKNRTLRFFIFSVFLVSIIVCFIVIIFNLAAIQSQSGTYPIPTTRRDYSVLITGDAENEFFLKQVYEGSTIVSNFYDSAIQYHIPDLKTQKNSMQSLFNYASYTNADCVVVYMDPDFEDFTPPVNSSMEKIPLITVGTYFPEISQVSHIGVNYAELGKSMAQESVEFLNGSGTIYILNTLDMEDFYNRTFVNNLNASLRDQEEIVIVNSKIHRNSGFSLEDDIRQQIASLGQIDLILSLSEQGTILAAQTVLDLNMGGKIKIIGFGNGYESDLYFEKGIVTELFKVDAVDIGKKAVQEFFEYTANGSANSYVTANIQLLRNRGEK